MAANEAGLLRSPLEVSRTASSEEIKKSSYRKLAVKFIRIRIPGRFHRREERFKELGEAYDVLMDAGQARGVRSLRARRLSRQGSHGGGRRRAAASTIPSISSAKSSAARGGGGGGIFEQFFGGGSGAAPGPRWPAARLRSALRHADQARGSRVRACEKEIEVSKLDALRPAAGLRRGKRFPRGDLPGVRRPGPGHQLARLFPGFADVPALPWHRARSSRNPCSRMRRRRAAWRARARIKLKIPVGIDDGARLRSLQAMARPASAAARRATCMSSST